MKKRVGSSIGENMLLILSKHDEVNLIEDFDTSVIDCSFIFPGCNVGRSMMKGCVG